MKNNRVVISLDKYDEIFDDFDISDYSSRAISSDFLFELRKRLSSFDKIPKIVLTIPSSARRIKDEEIILKRVKSYFSSKLGNYLKKKKEIKIRGIFYVFVGIFILVVISAFDFFVRSDLASFSPFLEIMSNFLFIPSWFFVWNGLDKLLEESKRYDKLIDFYRLLSKAKITFDVEEKYEN